MTTKLERVVSCLRKQGFKPFFTDGRLVDWRRINEDHILQILQVSITPSGRVVTSPITNQE